MAQARTNTQAMSISEAKEALRHLPGWKLGEEGKSISRHYKFSNFLEALDFVNKLGSIAEEHNHHPDLTLGWGYVGVTFTTHDIGGLHENDFVLAGKADSLKK